MINEKWAEINIIKYQIYNNLIKIAWIFGINKYTKNGRKC